MSQDFVRRLPNSGLMNYRKAGVGDVIHLDFTMLILLLLISAYGLLVLYSAVEQQYDMVISQSLKILMGVGVMVVIAQIPCCVYATRALGISRRIGHAGDGLSGWGRNKRITPLVTPARSVQFPAIRNHEIVVAANIGLVF